MRDLANGAEMRMTRNTTWTFASERPEAGSLMEEAMPGRANELARAGTRKRQAVLATLTDLIEHTRDYEYRAIIAELA